MDPLTGDSLGLDRLTERLAPYRQGFEVAEDGEESDTPLGLYLQPAMPRDILTRMLRNLKEIFSSQSDWQRLKCVLDRLIVLNPGAQIAELAERIGQPLLPWQKYVFDDYLTRDKNSQFIRRSGLLILPRQNGKTHLAKMRVLWGLFMNGEKNHLIMSSNRSMALSSFRDIAYTAESHDFLKDQIKQIRYANGTESIELKTGARLDVVAATRDGSRGRSASFLWIDELREIDEEAYAAALPTTRAVPNSQSLYTSNAGDAFSTVLNNMREKALSYPPKSLGFYEWSAPQYCKLDDVNAWYISNPSLGHLIDESALAEALTMQSTEQFRTESLSQWIDSLQSPWPHGAWEALADNSLQMSEGAYTVFAFDKSPSARHASLVAGQILPDGRIGLTTVS